VKRILFIVLVLIETVNLLAASHTYCNQSVLANGTWVKVRIDATGIYKITYEQLQNMGLDPVNVRVYGYGGAMLNENFATKKIDDLPPVGFCMYKGSDNTFGPGDYILFFGQGSTSWTYDNGRWKHIVNPYSNYGYYFLSSNAGEQKVLKPQSNTLSAEGATSITTFTDYQVNDIDRCNLIDQQAGVAGGGREFYGKALNTDSPTVTIDFSMPNIVSGTNLQCYLDMASTSSKTATILLGHNGTTKSLSMSGKASDFYTRASAGSLNTSMSAQSGDTQQFTLTYSYPGSAGEVYLNYLEVVGTRTLKMVSNTLFFRSMEVINKVNTFVYQIQGCQSSTQVWNITNPDSIYQEPITYQNGTINLLAKGGTLQQYVAVTPNQGSFLSVANQGPINQQNLHNLRNIDLIILCPETLRTQAEQLADAHATYDSLTSIVVTDQQVYNEFSSGTPDATAYRWIMKMLRDRAIKEGGQTPRYLLLMGDGTFDNRKILKTSGQSTLLTYQAKNSIKETDAYATDDYFAFLDDSESSSDQTSTMDIGVGRLPVNTSAEATVVVDKLIRYMHNQQIGPWKSDLCFVADDGDANIHTQAADIAAEKVRKHNPSFMVNKIYLDAFTQESNASGEKYPLAKNMFDNFLRNGCLFFDYCGHGGYNNITNEGILSLAEIKNLNNEKQAFWMLATCSFSHFDTPTRSCGEEALLNAKGGAIGVLSACRTVYASQNTLLNQHICDTLFARDENGYYYMRLGDAVRCAKNAVGKDMNKLPYILLGDPALRLAYPMPYQVITTSSPDTLKALAQNEIQGAVLNMDGTLSDFSGNVQIAIYDKIQTIRTNDNDESRSEHKTCISYLDYSNLLYKGVALAKQGNFSFTFITPKDIRYNLGKGKIVYYAYNEQNQTEGIGSDEDFLVGGSTDAEITDEQGPKIKLYLNDSAFQNGDRIAQTPHLFAFLEDEHGINTIGNGIGHDILLTIDNDASQTYVLNEYFVPEGEGSTAGSISYRLSELSEGEHTISLRAWDFINNSSKQTIRFTVVKDLAPQIYTLSAYPSPIGKNEVLTIRIRHDRPDDVISANVTLYNAVGEIVGNHQQTGANEMALDLSLFGIDTGVYLYKVQIQANNTSVCERTGRFIVK